MQTMNQISLYKKMTKTLEMSAGLKVSPLNVSYNNQGLETEIILNNDFDGILTVNEFDSMWSPLEHNLRINQKFTFDNPIALYGENGVTMPKNKIGLAVHIHSKTSYFQETLSFGTIPNINQPVSIYFSHNFPKDSLRGNIELDFFMYLQESNVYNIKHAGKRGMILSQEDFHNLVLVVDGEGSAFPMSEFEDKDGPLWRLDKSWVEANIDSFDASHVNLSINIAHPLFEQVKTGKQKISRAFMGDILVQAMTMIIQEVVFIEEKVIEDDSEALPGSILAAVNYWISTFNIDTSTLFSVANSMRAYWDRQMLDGGEKND